MKKLFVIMILSFLIFGLSLNAETKEENVTRDITGLAPHQQFNLSDARQVIQPNPSRDPDYQVYGYNAYDPTSAIPQGPVTFILNDPAGLTSLASTTSSDFIAGACWIADEETWYGSQYGGGLYSIDITTGAMTYIAATTEGLMGIDYDDASGIMYGSDGTSLYTVDWTTGATTLIGSHNVSYTMIGIAGDGDGNMYGVTVDFSLTSDLYSIDLATGNATSIGNTGGQLLYAQDIAFDKDDGVLYSAAYFGDGTPPGLYSIDTSTAAMTGFGDFPGGMEVSGFAIPYTLAEEDAPAAVSDLVVTPDAGGALSCVLDWVNPDLTFNGDPLTELLETRVYRDGALIFTNSSPGIGSPDGYTDAPTASGVYNYSVAAYNSAGEGPSVSYETWVGEDVPAAVTDLLLEESNGNGYLTWVNPTVGLNGGAFNNPILGYHIERSDGVVFEITGENDHFTDNTIPGADYFVYTITIYNSVGDGGVAVSNSMMLGAGSVIFFDDFEAGLGNWNSIINSGQGEWLIYAPPYPNGYQMPPTSSGNVCSADSDETGPSTTTDCTIELLTALDLSNFTSVNLQFDNDWNPISNDDYCYIDVTNDGGASWNNVLTWGGDNIDIPATHEIIDITAFAAGEANVNVRFVSVQPGWDWWWTIDNVGIYGTGTPADPGYIEGTVEIADGAGNVEDVVVEAGGETTNPASDGTYSIELQPGTYDVTATLAGYDTEVIEDIIVTEGNATTGVDFNLFTGSGEIVVIATKLNNNYPNPFNPVTNIAYSIKEMGNVTIEVYNLRGQFVKTLVNDVLETGDHIAIWDGTDNSNKPVSSGVYFYKMKAQNYNSTKKMILMK